MNIDIDKPTVKMWFNMLEPINANKNEDIDVIIAEEINTGIQSYACSVMFSYGV